MRNTGAELIHAKDGEEAMEVLKNNKRISIAVLDIVMPKKNGLTVVSACKPLMPDTTFIAYTADVLRLDQESCKQSGFDFCITKPILPVKFLKLIEEVLLQRKEYS